MFERDDFALDNYGSGNADFEDFEAVGRESGEYVIADPNETEVMDAPPESGRRPMVSVEDFKQGMAKSRRQAATVFSISPVKKPLDRESGLQASEDFFDRAIDTTAA